MVKDGRRDLTMEERVALVKGKFANEFGLSPDVIFYENGKIVAFRIITEENKVVSLIAEESNKGIINCYKKII
jgi:hypothetical protein